MPAIRAQPTVVTPAGVGSTTSPVAQPAQGQAVPVRHVTQAQVKDPVELTRVLQTIASDVRDANRAALGNPFAQANVIRNVPMVGGSMVVINHGLGQAIGGWVTTRPRGNVFQGYEITPQPAGIDPTRQIALMPLASGTYDVIVYPGDHTTPVVAGGSAGGGAGGISQLTGDVHAGPGSGSLAATVVGLQTEPVAATTPTAGQVLKFGGSQWAPATLAPEVVSGLSTARPGASHSAELYLTTDAGVASYDNPAGGGYQNFYGGYVGPNPAPGGSFTVVGAASLQQYGDAIVVRCAEGKADIEALLPIPAGVTPGGPWAATLIGSWTFDNSAYPGYGITVTNGTTGGTSRGLFFGQYAYNTQPGYPSMGIWIYTVHSQTKTNLEGPNDEVQNKYYAAFRILNDGVNCYFQQQLAPGVFLWRTVFTHALANILTNGYTMSSTTNYGISTGTANTGPGYPICITQSLSMTAVTQYPVTNAVLVPNVSFTITVGGSLPGNFMVGDAISCFGVLPNNSGINNVFNAVTSISGSNTIVVPTTFNGAFTYGSGGAVTILTE